MELPDFLRKFFNLYYDDSILLATILGYEIEEESYEAEYYQDWIEEKLTNFLNLFRRHMMLMTYRNSWAIYLIPHI